MNPNRPKPPFMPNTPRNGFNPNAAQLQKTPGGLVIPAAMAYDLDVVIKFNTQTGQSELQLHTHRPNMQIAGVQIAGILCEHATSVLRGLAQGGLKTMPVAESSEKQPEGGDNGDKP